MTLGKKEKWIPLLKYPQSQQSNIINGFAFNYQVKVIHQHLVKTVGGVVAVVYYKF
jgi:hypothetical protein